MIFTRIMSRKSKMEIDYVLDLQVGLLKFKTEIEKKFGNQNYEPADK